MSPTAAVVAIATHHRVVAPPNVRTRARTALAHVTTRAATVEGRLYGVNPIGERISSVVLGAMVFWDIPCTCLPSIYSVAGMGHHVGLAVLSAIALLPYTQHYAPFFIGVIEISSILP